MSSNKCSLTFPQNNIYMVEKFDNNSSINMIIGTLKISEKFNENICDDIINRLIKANDALRINVIEENNEGYQVINDYEYEKIECIDMSNCSQEDVDNYFRNSSKVSINMINNKLYDFKIIKRQNNSGYIIMKLHHIISDAWTFGQIINQFISIYDKVLNCQNEDLVVDSYLDFIKSEKEYVNSDKYVKDGEFWDEYLKNVQNCVSLKSSSKKLSTKASRYSVVLDESLNEKIVNYAKDNKISVYSLFLTAISAYIYRIKENNDFVIGTPTLNRANFKEKKILGMFVSTVPVRVNIEKNLKFIELAKKIGNDSMSLFRHQKFPFIKILDKFHKITNTNGKMYTLMFSYQNAKSEIKGNNMYSTNWIFSGNIENELDIHILDIADSGILNINYDYLNDLFSDIEIEYLHTRIIAIIENAIEDVDVSLEEIRIMSENESNKILKELNGLPGSYNEDKTVIDIFEEEVNKNPDNIALIFEEKKITYRELNEKSNQLANYLKEEKDVKIGDVLAISISRSVELIYSLIATLKCGCAYIPIDPTYPSERIEYILNSSKSKLLISDYMANYNIENINVKSINLDDINKSNLEKKYFESAYIIYTSGSTGNPKGVEITNKNLINFLTGINKHINISSLDNVVSITTISFDIFGLEIWLTLTNGAKLVLANEDEQINQEALNLLCIKNSVNVIQTTPTKIKMLTSNMDNIKYINNMNKILLGGESLSCEYISRLREITNSKIYNVYGPTETTIWSTINDITENCEITAGKPIQNNYIYIVDSDSRLLPINIPGELVIAGASLAKGYYNNYELTQDKFKFNKYINNKAYSTGDLASISFDGDLKILGRTDFQIKLNGQRIELEEIEQVILKYENIKHAIVSLHDNALICFYVSDNNMLSKELKKYLYDRLPVYMVPSLFIKIDEMPLTPNGKIDRKVINKIEVDSSKYEIVMPKTILQNSLYDSWKIVLRNKEFGINNNFFDMGGDSLDAIKIKIDLLSKGIKIEYSDIFKYPTIEELAAVISEKRQEIEYDIKGYNKDYSDILNRKYSDDTIVKKNEIGNVLLTGVTGFLGAHILSEFIDKNDGKIYCLIRNFDRLNPKERIKQTLNFFFDDKYDNLVDNRIIAIEGDISKKNMGLSSENLKIINDDVNFVVHSAACVKHYGEKNYFINININGTKNVADYCLQNNKKMIHISTLSVSGNAFESSNIKQKDNSEKIFNETSFYIGQDVNNVYVYTKFKAEELIFEYIKKGLEANIIRFGNLTGRYSDSKFQPNIEDNAFANRIKSIINIGVIPESCRDMYLEFTPVDLSGEFVNNVMSYFNMENIVFHAFNHNHVYIDRLIEILIKININIDIVSDSIFSENIKVLIEKHNDKLLKGIINDLNDDNTLNYTSNIKIKSYNTVEYMSKIGFEWKNIDDDYVINYIKYLKNIKFLN